MAAQQTKSMGTKKASAVVRREMRAARGPLQFCQALFLTARALLIRRDKRGLAEWQQVVPRKRLVERKKDPKVWCVPTTCSAEPPALEMERKNELERTKIRQVRCGPAWDLR